MIKELKLTLALEAVSIEFRISDDKKCYFVKTSKRVMEKLQERGVIGPDDWAKATDSTYIIYRNRHITMKGDETNEKEGNGIGNLYPN